MDNLSTFPYATVVAAIVGWYVVHRLSIARERDKFRRETIAKESVELCAMASTILEKSIDYHCTERNEVAERELKSLFDRLTLRIQHLPTMNDVVRNTAATHSAILFKQASTGIHFEDEHEGPLLTGDNVIASVQIAAFNLEAELLSIRSTTFAK
ncbi:hypothetical protein [Bordetella bronchiseptica]|uniref:hypothetical protein n=1 Tax=Bordetella bronchiseptica TaxID=518 RepID=UPI001248E6E8|nr:hypothetical protein [Bordetella bronchiseptica]KAB1444178.1 hypothetical protein F7D00_21190 [Bordetella bronchiseptica]KAB1569284.1 hypothetical protein F7890_21190 [Bordetella bronchiseptica]